MPFVHVNTGMPIDVVLAGSGLEDVFLSRVHQIDIGGMSVPILDAISGSGPSRHRS